MTGSFLAFYIQKRRLNVIRHFPTSPLTFPRIIFFNIHAHPLAPRFPAPIHVSSIPVPAHLTLRRSLMDQFRRISVNALLRRLFTKWRPCCSFPLAALVFSLPRGMPACGSEPTIQSGPNSFRPFSTQRIPLTTGDDSKVRDKGPVTDSLPRASHLHRLLSNPALTGEWAPLNAEGIRRLVT